MKKAILTIWFVILLANNSVIAADKYFYSSGQVLPGEQWFNVYVYNDSTVVDMSGGTVGNIESHDSSIVNISGGNLVEITILDSSTLNFSNNHINQLWAINEGTANISGGSLSNIGSYNMARINLYSGNNSGIAWINGESIFSMYGGITDRIGVYDTSIVNLRGGQITSWLAGSENAVINIYGHDISYNPIGGSWDGGQLKGFFLDNTEFSIDLYDIDTYSHINFIPEPTSVLLLGLGAFALRRKK